MTLGERLKRYRTRKGLSQEKIAELLGVSRQAVTKWEAGQTTPSSDHLMTLASLYELSLDELVSANRPVTEGNSNRPKDNPILRANLTKIAIICQTVFLNTAIQEYEPIGISWVDGLRVVLVLVPLLLSSIWMAWNLRYEKDKKQWKKNARIELLYCLIQLAIALVGYYAKTYFTTAVLLILVCLLYILYINPKYMNRTLVKRKDRK